MPAPELVVYGSEVSYFTGKLEAYLRFKEIPYERRPMTMRLFRGVVPEKTGAAQMPAVELPDGRWLTDTTPIIAWLETQHPEPAVIPEDPLQAFFSRLLEDHADEWLWRPAMHYRWSYADGRRLLSERIVRELMTDVPLPHALKVLAIRRRQLGTYVRKDGVDARTREHVEACYTRTLDQLSGVLEQRQFFLGERPTLADFGFMGPLFRHFALDPTPARIMRNRAPAVWAWVARVWNARAGRVGNARAGRLHGPLVEGVPPDWEPILDEIGATHLEHLCANAEAWKAGRRRFGVTIQGVGYRRLPTSRYRVWCLERLRAHFAALSEPDQGAARALLEKHACWEPLWRVEGAASGLDPEGLAPFAPGERVYPA
jgi:glutathione S-transferase